jgi:hypothetical protein
MNSFTVFIQYCLQHFSSKHPLYMLIPCSEYLRNSYKNTSTYMTQTITQLQEYFFPWDSII